MEVSESTMHIPPSRRKAVMKILAFHASASTVTALLIPAILALLPAIAGAQVIRDAHLLQLGPESVLIRWRGPDSLPSDPIVEYGLDPSALTSLAAGSVVIPPSNTSVRDHAVPIAGLLPETTYYYRFGTATGGPLGGGTPEHRFTTPSPAGAAAPLAVWVLGDSGHPDTFQLAVRDAMLAATDGAAADLLIHLGDIAYESGTDSQLTDLFFAPYAEILRRVPTWPTFGNHEAQSSDSATQSGPYYEAFVLPVAGEFGGVPSGTRAYYSFDLHHVHFISLDTAEGDLEPPSAMLDWLAADLASTLAPWVVTFLHHPPYTKGSHDSDDAGDSGGRLVAVREHVVPLLEAGGVDLVLAGHSHGYERSFLLDGVHGYGVAPDFVTPPAPTLLAAGEIVDAGDGDADGDGAYAKSASAAGTVYVVAGHGGRPVSGSGGHPVTVVEEFVHGSCRLRVDGDLLWLENVRIDGSITDRFVITKGAASHRVIETISGAGRIRRSPDRPLFAPGEIAMLTAEPRPGWVFSGWRGAASGADPSVVIAMTADAEVTATFLPASPAGFIAYVDLAWTDGQLAENIRAITSPSGGSGLPSGGELVDRATGLPTGATLTVQGGTFDGDGHALELSGGPLPGTDAEQAFAGHVSAHGSISYVNSATPGGDLRLLLSGLDPLAEHELVLYGNRNEYGWDRAMLVTLEGAVGFENQSSAATDNPDPGSGGALFSGPLDPSTRLPAGNPAGYVARFVSVVAGADGAVELVCSFDGATGSAYRGKYANALMVKKIPAPLVAQLRRGDVNASGTVNIADAIGLLGYLFLSGSLGCLEAADVEGDGGVTVGDAISLLSYLFTAGLPPEPPFPDCGPATGGLGCSAHPSCP
jgi:hypothetical protein